MSFKPTLARSLIRKTVLVGPIHRLDSFLNVKHYCFWAESDKGEEISSENYIIEIKITFVLRFYS